MAAVPEIQCAGLFIYRLLQNRIEYLLLQASDGIHHWTPPKGHLEEGENLITAAIRETEEESGIKREDYEIIEDFPMTLDYIARKKTKRVHYWLAGLKNPNTPVKLSHEHQDYCWADAQTALRMSHRNLGDIIRRSEEHLRNRGTT